LAGNVTFSATGETANGGTFVLCDASDVTQARAIFLGANGRIRMYERNSTGTPLDDGGTPIASCTP
jgi:hypothetical protein